jgi:hypothetical protein
MRHNDKVNNSAVGLDVGTSRICLAQRVGEEYQYETQLNAFVTIPFSKMTENVFKKEKVPHTVTGPEIVVHGNESDRFADLLNVETRRTMDKGVLNAWRWFIPNSKAPTIAVSESVAAAACATYACPICRCQS